MCACLSEINDSKLIREQGEWNVHRILAYPASNSSTVRTSKSWAPWSIFSFNSVRIQLKAEGPFFISSIFPTSWLVV